MLPSTIPHGTPPVSDDVSTLPGTSWYLDPLVAEQKRKLHAELVRGFLRRPVGLALKTDSFEEAFGLDSPLVDILPLARQWIGMDLAVDTVRRASARMAHFGAAFLGADTRRLPLRTASLDAIFSNSTLDHFETVQEFETAIQELTRVLRPGGLLILTIDNPINPTYWPLYCTCRTGFAPFKLGYTPTPWRLRQILESAGLEIAETGQLIHNPRLLSTVLFMALRRLLGRRADTPVRALLAAFQFLDRLPTRRLTACFHTVCARRPLA